MRVFWSWQSDTSPREGREFIRFALEEAVKLAGKELDVADADRPELDHDTKGAKGMVNIAEVILEKIGSSALFIADVTPLTRAPNGKPLPNPNVMIELGWALHKPGEERVIAVLNNAEGWKVEELPFDIRGRSVIQYSLAVGATTEDLRKERERLTKVLAEAVKTNLGDYLAGVALETVIAGVAARAGEPSIWDHAVQSIEIFDPSFTLAKKTINREHGGRGYARIIPASWPDGVPPVSQIGKLPDELVVWPPSDGMSDGDGGPTTDGYCRYWVSRMSPDTTGSISMFFEETGEFWVLFGRAIIEEDEGKYLRVGALISAWAKSMERAMKALDFLGAAPVRRVEVGVTGLADAQFLSESPRRGPRPRKPLQRFTFQGSDWGKDAQADFLWRAYNDLRNVYGLAHEEKGEFLNRLPKFKESY